MSPSRRRRAFTRLIEIFQPLEPRTLFAAWAPDPSFGDGGAVVRHITANDESGNAINLAGQSVARQGSKLIATLTGTAASPLADPYVGDALNHVAITRLNADGTVDASFGTKGIATGPASVDGGVARKVVLAPDGRILVLAQVAKNDLGFLERFSADGKLDTSFGSGGRVQVGYANASGLVRGVGDFTVQADGEIVLLYSSGNDPDSGTASLGRLNVDGSTDASFGNKGNVTLPTAAYEGGRVRNVYTRPSHVMVQGDGNIVASAHVFQWADSPFPAQGTGVWRFDSDGGADGSFDHDGLVNLDFHDAIGSAAMFDADLETASGGRIVLVGDNENGNLFLARLKSDGSADGSLDDDGFAILAPAPGVGNHAYAATLASDGSTFIAGTSESRGAFIARADATGVLDPQFGSGGYIQIADHIATDVVLPSAGRVLIVGGALASNRVTNQGNYDFYTAQFTDGSGVSTPPAPANPASVSGTLFSDANANGKLDGGEAKLAKRTLFLDANNNGKYDSGETTTKTSSTGKFTFGGLAAGTVHIGMVLPSGWRASGSGGTVQAYTLASGQTLSGRTLGQTTRSRVAGSLFNDGDGDGKLDKGEKAVSGWMLFVDADNDGKLDKGERTTTTNANGDWSFDNLGTSGNVVIRLVVASKYKSTTPKGAAYTVALASGLSVSGKRFGVHKA